MERYEPAERERWLHGLFTYNGEAHLDPTCHANLRAERDRLLAAGKLMPEDPDLATRLTRELAVAAPTDFRVGTPRIVERRFYFRGKPISPNENSRELLPAESQEPA